MNSRIRFGSDRPERRSSPWSCIFASENLVYLVPVGTLRQPPNTPALASFGSRRLSRKLMGFCEGSLFREAEVNKCTVKPLFD
jgi:hypothetical protein